MASRSVYLATYRGPASQRVHFAIFIPNAADDSRDLSVDFRSDSTKGTVIHVVGEPVMNGYTLEFKRNYDLECEDSRDLQKLVTLGTVDAANLYDPPSTDFVRESTPRGTLEREAAKVAPPGGGQNVRAPIDGVTTKRCQEWTMEFLKVLADQGLIDASAVSTAEAERDPPNHGIFGAKKASS